MKHKDFTAVIYIILFIVLVAIQLRFADSFFDPLIYIKNQLQAESQKKRQSLAQSEGLVSEFSNQKLKNVFLLLVHAYPNHVNLHSRKIDFNELSISQNDLRLLGHIVASSERSIEERQIAFYMLSQVGVSAHSAMMMLADIDLDSYLSFTHYQ